MKRKLLVCALVACAMTLCLALTGCGGGAANDKDAKEAFIGSWKLAGMVSDGEEATAEDIAMLDVFGMSVGLDVNEDGTCALIMFGEPLDGHVGGEERYGGQVHHRRQPHHCAPSPTASCR